MLFVCWRRLFYSLRCTDLIRLNLKVIRTNTRAFDVASRYATMMPSSTDISVMEFVMGWVHFHSLWITGISLFSIPMISSRHFTSSRSSRSFLVSASNRLTVASNDCKIKGEQDERKKGEKIIPVLSPNQIIMQSKKCFWLIAKVETETKK